MMKVSAAFLIIVFSITLAIRPSLLLAKAQTTAAGSSSRKNCMEDNFLLVHKQEKGLVCTTKQIHLENLRSHNPDRATCNEGTMLQGIDLQASVVFNTGRYDVGWFIATDGGDALTGNCHSRALLEGQLDGHSGLLLDFPGSDKITGKVVWDRDIDGGDVGGGNHDECGDIVMHYGGQGTLDDFDVVKNITLPCVDKNRNGNLDFSICFTWRQSGTNDKCNPNMLYPGTSRKCYCTRYDIEQITVNRAYRAPDEMC